MNLFQKSILNNEITMFLLGQGEYYHHDRDWDCHDYTSSWFDIMLYSLETENDSAFPNLDKGIVNILEKRNDAESRYASVMYICNYYYYSKEETKLKERWFFSNELKKMVQEKIHLPLGLEPHKEHNIKGCIEKLRGYNFFSSTGTHTN